MDASGVEPVVVAQALAADRGSFIHVERWVTAGDPRAAAVRRGGRDHAAHSPPGKELVQRGVGRPRRRRRTSRSPGIAPVETDATTTGQSLAPVPHGKPSSSTSRWPNSSCFGRSASFALGDQPFPGTRDHQVRHSDLRSSDDRKAAPPDYQDTLAGRRSTTASRSCDSSRPRTRRRFSEYAALVISTSISPQARADAENLPPLHTD
jgi:hypothetical protein